METVSCNGLRFVIEVYSSLEQSVNRRYNNAAGLLKKLLGMSTMIGCKNRMQYVMNHLGLIPSYETIDRTQKKLVAAHTEEEHHMLHDVGEHRLAIFSVDNIDTTNKHGILISGNYGHVLHLLAI